MNLTRDKKISISNMAYDTNRNILVILGEVKYEKVISSTLNMAVVGIILDEPMHYYCRLIGAIGIGW